MEPPTNALTALVVPCYNEEHRLRAESFVAFARSRSDVQLLFIDDGSRDRTPEMIEQICRGGTSMELLRLPQNQGKAEAVRLGFLAAFEKSPRYLGYWDADLSTPLEAQSSFERVFEELPAVEMVFGSRVMLLGRDVVREPYRHYFGRAFASLASAILQLPIYDTQCGAKLFRNTETLRKSSAPLSSPSGYSISRFWRGSKRYVLERQDRSPNSASTSSRSSGGITSAIPRSG